MYVERNNEARSINHCCSTTAIPITYSDCVCVALFIQHAIRMRRIVICGLPRQTIFFYIFEKKITEHKMCFDFLYKFV
jgi:hypothetical protein